MRSPSSPSQADMILERLASGASLTPVEALRDFGCFRLAARIAELKEHGNDIETEMRDGHAVYRLRRRVTPLRGNAEPQLAENEQRALWGDR